jgi:hypothetical protein
MNRSLAVLSFACISVMTAGADAQSLVSEKKDLTGFAARKVIEAAWHRQRATIIRSRSRSSIPPGTWFRINRPMARQGIQV